MELLRAAREIFYLVNKMQGIQFISSRLLILVSF